MDNASILPGLVGLLSQFNGSVLEGKALVVVNETVDKGDSSKFGAVETLKSLITDDQISVEHKGRDRRQIDNYARFMFCSNHLDGLPFDENERRFFAIVCQATEALDADFYAQFVELVTASRGWPTSQPGCETTTAMPCRPGRRQAIQPWLPML